MIELTTAAWSCVAVLGLLALQAAALRRWLRDALLGRRRAQGSQNNGVSHGHVAS